MAHNNRDCSGSVTSLGHNLIGNLSGCTIALQVSDLTGEPELGDFTDTDDETPGYGHVPLLPDSPAINAGHDEACPETDQLGQPRVGHCDIGAIESQEPVDAHSPAITVSANPATLWPPNGKLVPVTLSGTITDEPDGSGVKPNSAVYQVMDEYGQVQPSGSVTPKADGSYVFTTALQASRNENDRDGRQYMIVVSATDNAGNRGVAWIIVIVPHH